MRWKALTIVTIFLIQSITPVAVGEDYSRYRYTTSYRFENRGGDSFNLSEDMVKIPLFWNSESQKVDITNSSGPITNRGKDLDGNPLGIVEMPMVIEPDGNVSFYVTYEIESREVPRVTVSLDESESLEDIPESLIDDYCISTETFMSNYDEIEEMASLLAGSEESTLLCVLNLLNWFINNATYANYEVPKYPNETLKSGTGDCDDQAILLISMLRSLGIPSFLQVGVVFHDSIQTNKKSWNGHLEITQKGIGWHGWAMVFIPPWGWLPIDLTLNQKDDAIKLINDAPEFRDYIIPVLNISKQAYIGDTMETREAMINSDLYVVVVDEGVQITGNGNFIPDVKMIILAILLVISISSLFIISRRNK